MSDYLFWSAVCRHLLPFVTVLYLLSFLWVHTIFRFRTSSLICFPSRQRDRSNIGNAKVAGMAKDLKLVGLKYNIAAAVFFVSIRLTQEMLDLGKLTRCSSDTLQPCGNTFVRIFINKRKWFNWTIFLEILLSSSIAPHDGVSQIVSTQASWSAESDCISQFRALWSPGGWSWHWCA